VSKHSNDLPAEAGIMREEIVSFLYTLDYDDFSHEQQGLT
jgi:hypothetical protein